MVLENTRERRPTVLIASPLRRLTPNAKQPLWPQAFHVKQCDPIGVGRALGKRHAPNLLGIAAESFSRTTPEAVQLNGCFSVS
jgi:hypothetical protein